MTKDILKNWEHGIKDLTATTSVYKICSLRGGESATIKALAANSGYVYIGSDRLLSTSTGFQLGSGNSVSLTLPKSFGVDNHIDVYAVCSSAGDDVCYIKLIDFDPETSGG